MDDEIYFCTDIEVNGPTPGHYSMLSFATVAFTLDKKVISTFERNLDLLPNAKEHPRTMNWWKTEFPQAYALTRENTIPPGKALNDYTDWVVETTGKGPLSKNLFEDNDKKPIFVAHPATLDHMFMTWYLEEFVGYTPFYICGFDMSSYHAGMQKIPFKKSGRPFMPDDWNKDAPDHDHTALTDAMGHAMAFCNMVAANQKGS